MSILKVGDQFTSELVVEEKHTAAAFGSGNILVFSTPMMIGLMENAALNCAQLNLSSELSTVGTYVNVKHVAATPIGQKVTAIATLVSIEGTKLEFRVEAFDEIEKIGEGMHGRYIIDAAKFLDKVNLKSTDSKSISK